MGFFKFMTKQVYKTYESTVVVHKRVKSGERKKLIVKKNLLFQLQPITVGFTLFLADCKFPRRVRLYRNREWDFCVFLVVFDLVCTIHSLFQSYLACHKNNEWNTEQSHCFVKLCYLINTRFYKHTSTSIVLMLFIYSCTCIQFILYYMTSKYSLICIG